MDWRDSARPRRPQPPRAPVTRRQLLRGTVGLGMAGLLAAVVVRTAPSSPPVDESAFLQPTALPSVPAPPTAVPATAAPTTTVAAAATVPAVPTGDPVPVGATPTTAPNPSPTAVPAAPTPVPTPDRQPNVLLVSIDTLRADRLGTYGFSQAHTPVLDQLAKEGTHFTRATCQLPQTDPSHAALMTGLYASTNGVKVHMVDRLRPGSQTLATVFQSAGYQTAGIYSWVSLDPQFCGLDQGFQTYQGYVIGRSGVFSNPLLEQLAHTYRQLKSDVPVLSAADAAVGVSSDYENTLDGRADVTNAGVFKWLDGYDGKQPFFLWVHYYDPHYPYTPPAGYDHLFNLDYHGSIDGSVNTIHELQHGQLHPSPDDLARLGELYQGEIAYTDSQFGELLARLAQMGVKDDTIIAVTGDHGESFGEHGDWTHGLKVYETEIRVPLILRYPGRVPAGAAFPGPVQVIDLMPTLLDLAGIQPKQGLQGTSMVPLLTGQDNGANRAAFTELADDSFVTVLTFGNWKLIRNDANGSLQLFNLNADEAEQTDLAGQNQTVTAELATRLQDLMQISGVSH
jgi:arylsulfatase A-like enzyme